MSSPLARSTARSRVQLALGAFALGLTSGIAATLARRVAAVLAVGAGHSAKHRALDLASALAQTKHPLDAMSTYLNGFHAYADDLGRQVEASHFCVHLAHDLHQCVIFDRNASDARLIGIEYIVSAERFAQLPEEEKRLWHSHHHEVSSGVLIAPGVPEAAEHAYLEDLITTYGKTFHTWQYDRDDFPYGIPQLMMAFTADGQADEAKIRQRDRRLGVSSDERRAARADIAVPTPDPAANAWQRGRTVRTTLEEVAVRRMP